MKVTPGLTKRYSVYFDTKYTETTLFLSPPYRRNAPELESRIWGPFSQVPEGGSVELTWDRGNRLTQIVDRTCTNPATSLNCATVASSRVITRQYDLLDRLIREVTPQGEVNYTYDAGGRRLTMVLKNSGPWGQVSHVARTHSTNALTIVPNGANSRLTRWGGKTYSYDPNGNLLADGTHSYQWNERNQLTGLSAGGAGVKSCLLPR